MHIMIRTEIANILLSAKKQYVEEEFKVKVWTIHY